MVEKRRVCALARARSRSRDIGFISRRNILVCAIGRRCNHNERCNDRPSCTTGFLVPSYVVRENAQGFTVHVLENVPPFGERARIGTKYNNVRRSLNRDGEVRSGLEVKSEREMPLSRKLNRDVRLIFYAE